MFFLFIVGPDVVVEPSVVPNPGKPESPVPTPRRQQPIPSARGASNDATGPRERFGRDYLNAALSAGYFLNMILWKFPFFFVNF